MEEKKKGEENENKKEKEKMGRCHGLEKYPPWKKGVCTCTSARSFCPFRANSGATLISTI